MSKIINLTQGKSAIVDDEDYENLVVHKWHCTSKGYAARNIPTGEQGKQTLVRMHRQIMNAAPDMEVDHWNLNKLDNRRLNLRICTFSENQRNRGKLSNNTSGFKGVSWHKRAHKFRAQIKLNGKQKSLGCYPTAEEASAAYVKAAHELHGNFARV